MQLKATVLQECLPISARHDDYFAQHRILIFLCIKSGDMRKDIEPFDLLRALIGVSSVLSSPDWQQSAKRLVDILITGSRP